MVSKVTIVLNAILMISLSHAHQELQSGGTCPKHLNEADLKEILKIPPDSQSGYPVTYKGHVYQPSTGPIGLGGVGMRYTKKLYETLQSPNPDPGYTPNYTAELHREYKEFGSVECEYDIMVNNPSHIGKSRIEHQSFSPIYFEIKKEQPKPIQTTKKKSKLKAAKERFFKSRTSSK